MNNRINEIQDEIIDEFSGFSDWMDKYSYIIEMGNALPPIDERHKTPDNILDANLYFIDSIGLTEHLSPTRSNGLLAMVKQIKMYALAYKTKEQQQQ